MGESLELAASGSAGEQSAENSQPGSPVQNSANNRASKQDHTEPSECEPLQSGPSNPASTTDDVKIEMSNEKAGVVNGEAQATSDAADSDTEEKLNSAKPVTADGKRPYKKQRKCLFVGVILLTILLCGAIVAILARRFTGMLTFQKYFACLCSCCLFFI